VQSPPPTPFERVNAFLVVSSGGGGRRTPAAAETSLVPANDGTDDGRVYLNWIGLVSIAHDTSEWEHVAQKQDVHTRAMYIYITNEKGRAIGARQKFR